MDFTTWYFGIGMVVSGALMGIWCYEDIVKKKKKEASAGTLTVMLFMVVLWPIFLAALATYYYCHIKDELNKETKND